MKHTLQFLLFLASIFSIEPVSGQQEQPGNDRNTPGKEHTVYNTMQGDWDVFLKIPVGNGKYIDGKTSCKAEWVMDGRFMRLEYNSSFEGKPLTVVRYLGFDRYKNKYTEIHFESTHTDFMTSEGTISSDEKIITCWGNHVDVATNQVAGVRTVTTFVDNDLFVLEMIYTDTSGKDLKTVTLTHKRKK